MSNFGIYDCFKKKKKTIKCHVTCYNYIKNINIRYFKILSQKKLKKKKKKNSTLIKIQL